MAQQQIPHLRRKTTDSLKHIVQVGLRNARLPRQTPFGQFASPQAPLNVRDQPELKQLEVHGSCWK